MTVPAAYRAVFGRSSVLNSALITQGCTSPTGGPCNVLVECCDNARWSFIFHPTGIKSCTDATKHNSKTVRKITKHMRAKHSDDASVKPPQQRHASKTAIPQSRPATVSDLGNLDNDYTSTHTDQESETEDETPPQLISRQQQPSAGSNSSSVAVVSTIPILPPMVVVEMNQDLQVPNKRALSDHSTSQPVSKRQCCPGHTTLEDVLLSTQRLVEDSKLAAQVRLREYLASERARHASELEVLESAVHERLSQLI